jgi:hypothetical protein
LPYLLLSELADLVVPGLSAAPTRTKRGCLATPCRFEPARGWVSGDPAASSGPEDGCPATLPLRAGRRMGVWQPSGNPFQPGAASTLRVTPVPFRCTVGAGVQARCLSFACRRTRSEPPRAMPSHSFRRCRPARAIFNDARGSVVSSYSPTRFGAHLSAGPRSWRRWINIRAE